MKKILIATLILGVSAFASSSTYTEYVDVVNSKPTYENVIVKVPHRECYDEVVPARRHNVVYSNQNSYRNDSGAAIVGGLIGGVLGHQIGKGHGKDAATIGGAIIGSLIGQNSRHRPNNTYNASYDNSYSSCETKRRCQTTYSERSERKFMGYKNVGYYKGRKIVKYSDRRLSTIPVHITINY